MINKNKNNYDFSSIMESVKDRILDGFIIDGVERDPIDENLIRFYYISTPVYVGNIPIRMDFTIEEQKECPECKIIYEGLHPEDDCKFGITQSVLHE